MVLSGQVALKSDTLTINVPATANPYLAGMPIGAKARVGDSSPQQSPVLVGRTLDHAVAVTFGATGLAQHTPECPPTCHGPNGDAFVSHDGGSEHGLAGIIAPMDSLVGVFLSGPQPDKTKAPKSFDFSAIRGDFKSFSPKLKQLFFIGNGKTASRDVRRYLVPANATRLYLGTMDSYEWNNNSGSFTVTVTIERDRVETSMFVVDSNITFEKWACLPDRARCTPDRPMVEERTLGVFHVILPASSEWSISVSDIKGRSTIHAAAGEVCLTRGRVTARDQRGSGTQRVEVSLRRIDRWERW